MRSKRTPNLRNLVERRLAKLTLLLVPMRLTDVDEDECSALAEGTGGCAEYIEGVRLNDEITIFLDAWGFPGQDERRYTFTVFARPKKRWQLVQGHIEEINEAVAVAVHTLVEQA